MLRRINHFINGRRVVGSSGREQAVYDPATEHQTGTVDLAVPNEVRQAVVAALAAFPQWADITPLRRARVLNRFLRIIEDRMNDLAAVITSEHGKTLSDSPTARRTDQKDNSGRAWVPPTP
jgi:malonate-semialdehyde dehydrogenase (acetylating) / methylmalonate-semialdehyde dehydrogenase